MANNQLLLCTLSTAELAVVGVYCSKKTPFAEVWIRNRQWAFAPGIGQAIL